MPNNTPSHICGVFILSQDPASLAKFYTEAIGLPLTYDHADTANGENSRQFIFRK